MTRGDMTALVARGGAVWLTERTDEDQPTAIVTTRAVPRLPDLRGVIQAEAGPAVVRLRLDLPGLLVR